MKYTIFSIDDSREHYISEMRHRLHSWGWNNEVSVPGIDGRDDEALRAAMLRHPYEIHPSGEFPKRGHLGIWYTVLDALEHAPIVTFEDDAILSSIFGIHWAHRMEDMPEDTDFFALFNPRDSDHMLTDEHRIGGAVVRAYQRYGGVSMYYTEQGAKNIKKLLWRDGITGQYDDTLFEYSRRGELNGYTSYPEHSLVGISGWEQSIVQETERFIL